MLRLSGIAGGDEAHDMCVVCQPTVTRHLEQVGALPWVGDKDALEEISCVWCDVFGESERGGDDVLVQKVDVVTLRVSWVVVEGQVASQHGVLRMVSL